MRCLKPKKIKEVFHVVIDGRQAGPLNKSELERLVKNGIVTADTFVWTPGLAQWTPAQCVPDVNKLLLLSYKPDTRSPAATKRNSGDSVRKDLISAIASLGYRKSDIQAAVDKVLEDSPDIGLEDGVKAVLRIIY